MPFVDVCDPGVYLNNSPPKMLRNKVYITRMVFPQWELLSRFCVYAYALRFLFT